MYEVVHASIPRAQSLGSFVHRTSYFYRLQSFDTFRSCAFGSTTHKRQESNIASHGGAKEFERMVNDVSGGTCDTENTGQVVTATARYIDAPPIANQAPFNLERSDLITRINELEARLKSQTEQIRALTQASKSTTNPSSPSSIPTPQYKPRKQPNPFDPSAHHTRHIALKLSYLGTPYNGFEHTNNVNSAPPLPTVEEVLWKALRKARLISPEISNGADQSYDVVWDPEERARKYGRGLGGGEDGAGGNIKGGQKGTERLELNWDGCQWSKCGRTDKGVSAFGQVVGVRVRSSRPKPKEVVAQAANSSNGPTQEGTKAESTRRTEKTEMMTQEKNDASSPISTWDPVRDEIPYISILNGLLPSSIRILAWCPHPPDLEWDARFFCKERRYKYFFTNPAFCPTPGPSGWKDNTGRDMPVREGWLDIEAMRIAAKKLEGLHDFRNFCKIDASKQMSSCERRVTFADVTEFDTGIGAFVENPALAYNREALSTPLTSNGTLTNDDRSEHSLSSSPGPTLYTFAVHGTAFLWHQVRCMASILFLIGQGLESPSLVDTLLDINSTPGRPNYEMADDTALVLWDCVFPGDDADNDIEGERAPVRGGTDGGGKMNWIYAGDASICSSHPARGDGKFGVGGVVENLFTGWRKAKLDEALSAGLLGLALRQGDGSALRRGGLRGIANGDASDEEQIAKLPRGRSQRVFDGSETPKLVGKYTPVMKRTKAESLEVINEKYARGKQARRDAKRVEEEAGGVGVEGTNGSS